MSKSTEEQLRDLLDEYPDDASVFRTSQLKPDGSRRPIVKQGESLNKWLKQVKRTLRMARKDWPLFIHGGVRKRSYVSFARPHTDKKTVITLDIRDCFDSISRKQVQGVLVRKLGLSDALSRELSSRLCIDNKIPQGFSTSNFLTNLYLNDVLLGINRKLSPMRLTMTVYVDDIAISGNTLNSAEVINLVCTDLSRAGLAVKKAKIKVMHSHMRQTIVGLVVNKRVSLTKEKTKELFARVNQGSMSQESLDGWLSNLRSIDAKTTKKLTDYALQKGYEVNGRYHG